MSAPNPVQIVTTAVASETSIVLTRLVPLSLVWRGAAAADALIVKDDADVVIFTWVAPAVPVTGYSMETDLSRKTGPITGIKVSTLGGGNVDIYYRK